jgi:delta-1-pyrroline-5-carboxylate synthetase
MYVQHETDTVFTDNDGLAAKLAHQLHADLVVLMTDVDGVYTGPPTDPNSKLIEVWSPKLHDHMIEFGANSKHGRGGMASKIRAAWFGAESGATVVIMNGKYPENLVKIIEGEKVRLYSS